MAFTPVRLVSKKSDESVIVTTAVDYVNLQAQGYVEDEDQDGIEDALKGGLDNGVEVEKDEEPKTETPETVVAVDSRPTPNTGSNKNRGGNTAAATTDAGSTPTV